MRNGNSPIGIRRIKLDRVFLRRKLTKRHPAYKKIVKKAYTNYTIKYAQWNVDFFADSPIMTVEGYYIYSIDLTDAWDDENAIWTPLHKEPLKREFMLKILEYIHDWHEYVWSVEFF